MKVFIDNKEIFNIGFSFDLRLLKENQFIAIRKEQKGYEKDYDQDFLKLKKGFYVVTDIIHQMMDSGDVQIWIFLKSCESPNLPKSILDELLYCA
jgi:hypothetical protein